MFDDLCDSTIQNIMKAYHGRIKINNNHIIIKVCASSKKKKIIIIKM